MKSRRVERFGEPLVAAQTPEPRPEGREVLVRVRACGVCHSDVHLHDGYFDLGDGRKVDLARSVSPPRVLGHEIAGEIVAAGPEAKDAPVGARRVVFPWIGCGNCPICVSGNEHLCNNPRALGVNRDGGFADHVLVPDSRYLLDYGDLPEEQACTYACSGLTAYGALSKAGSLATGDKLLVIGAGGVGLSGVRMAKKLFGVAPIVAETNVAKHAAALAAGAGEVIDPAAPDSARNLAKATGGGVAAAIDFVGAGASFAFGVDAVRRGGKLIVVGLFGGSTPLAPPMIVLKALTIVGSYVGSLDELRALLKLAQGGTFPPLPVETRPLDAADEALAKLKRGAVVGRTVLRP